MDIFQGPVDLILSDLDLRSTSLEVRRSKSFFANNLVLVYIAFKIFVWRVATKIRI